VGDASADAGGPPCGVTIQPVSYPNLDGLPAGPTSTLRVRGTITGSPLPKPPAWTWKVSLDPSGSAVTFTQDATDPSVIEFPLATASSYLIQATVSAMPLCQGQAIATATLNPSVWYWVRVTPPLARAELPPLETTLMAQAGSALSNVVYHLERGVSVTIDPRTAAHISVPSYVRVSSPIHSWLREGDTSNTAAFPTTLVNDPQPSYDLLIVPLPPPDGGGTLWAPKLVSQRSAGQVGALLTVDDDLALGGVTDIEGGGGPVMGATVVLRVGSLTSTVGTSDSGGAFSLRAQPARFAVVVLPPDGAPLADGHVDAAGAGVLDIVAASAGSTLHFSWHAPSATSLTATLTSSAGGPAGGVDVRLDTVSGALPDVGTLSTGAQTFTATGEVHRRATTSSAGTVTFTSLPRARYQLVALPAVGATDGLTAAAVDLTGTAGASATVAVTLAPKVTVKGSVPTAPAGTRILILDDQPELARSFPEVALGTGGAFTLSLDRNHAYHLVVDPPRAQGLSRVPLGELDTAAAAINQPATALPRMLTMQGTIVTDGGQTLLSGALVQVFCFGPGPDCVDASDLAAKDPPPLSESLSDDSGAFSVVVPDPAGS
jgi:hypothetical protein